ncbi:hypothetical protein BD410DRAFT_714619 [Rickenella mellea]|uniref:Carrier domain-containing protein n=1 Tax=Rickenella mellea TaxID=50990 RepID=A0A4Y7QK87_9AGAM|nr:hypothetical protein BD410DRAFT_714619 [Rickenella mellea]
MAINNLNTTLAGYRPFALPNLSTLRKPLLATEQVTLTVPGGCIELVVLAALAKCLGDYCSTSDVLFGSFIEGHAVRVVRVKFNMITWEEVIRNISTTEVSEKEICNTFKVDGVSEPFAAWVSQDASSTHPLVVSISATTVSIAYSTARFHSSTAKSLAEQMEILIEHIITHPSSSPRHVTFLPPHLLSRWNESLTCETSHHVRRALFVTDLLSRQAMSTPHASAVEFYADLNGSDAQNMTYAELNTRSNQFARHLVDEGMRREDRIALCMPRGLDFHICLLGVLKAGCCYVPIDPELPPERQSFIAQDSECRLVLTSSSASEHLSRSVGESTEDINLARRNDLAYMLYTSGTTGVPKGCLLTHLGLSEAILAMSTIAAEVATDNGRYLAVASIAFDVHLAETFVPFALGMVLISAQRSQLFENLPKWIRKLGVTHVGIVPSLIEATMGAVEQFSGSKADIGGEAEMKLRYIASGGEKMSDTILERWANHPKVKLANFYGPSEVTIGCAARFMSSTTNRENIGRVFPNCSAVVVDHNLEVVMKGAVGELIVAGPLVGRGYHKRPELSAKVFLEWDGQPAYRTGDLAVRMMPDSSLEILGRIDTQVKLRGVRIEVEGISSILREAAADVLGPNSKLDLTTVLARHDQLNADQLVSFIAWNPTASITHRQSSVPNILTTAPAGLYDALRDACATSLASYMRPAHVISLEFLPLNSNGKIDNKSLVSLFQTTSLEVLGQAKESSLLGTLSSTTRPLSDTEQKLIEIAACHTQVPLQHLNVASNLFELGFDSMAFIHMASQISSEFSLSSPVTVSEVMKMPTIDKIATLIESPLFAVKSRSLTSFPQSVVEDFGLRCAAEVSQAFDQDKVEAILPTFPIQDGVLYRSSGSENPYVQHVILRLQENVVTEDVKAAWVAAINRHESLRTVFLFSKYVIQIILRPWACELPWQEKSLGSKGTSDVSAWFLDKEAAVISNDILDSIETVPPFRLRLYSTHNGRFLTLSIHHSIFDGISLSLLLKDVERGYFKHGFDSKMSLPRALDYVLDVDLYKARLFWQCQFSGFNWSRTTYKLASRSHARNISAPFKGDISNLKTLAAKLQVTPQTLLTAAYGVCLRRWVYQHDDLAFGVIRSGRSFVLEALNTMISPMLSIIPIRVNLKKPNVLRKIHEFMADVIPFEHVPLSKVQGWLQPGETLFETLFSVSWQENETSSLWDVISSTQPQADYCLSVEVVIDRLTGQIAVQASFTDDDLPTRTVLGILNDLEAVAESFARATPTSTSEDVTHVVRNTVHRPIMSNTENAEVTLHDGNEVDKAQEKAIRVLTAQFLDLPLNQVQPLSSLISLGLDSIKAMGLSSKLRTAGVAVSAIDLMKHSNIRLLVAHYGKSVQKMLGTVSAEEHVLSQSRKEIMRSFNSDSVKLSSSDNVELYPVTTLQAGMLSQTIGSSRRLYVHAFVFELLGKIDIEKLKTSWENVIRSTAILRSSFHFHHDVGNWIQAVHSDTNVDWTDAGCIGTSSRHEFILQFIDQLDWSSEDAFAHPPIRFLIFEDHWGVCRLVMVLHHALYDGESIRILSEAVWSIYRGETIDWGRQFHDFMGYFQRQENFGVEFWVRHLSGFSPPPTIKDEIEIGVGSAGIASRDIDLQSDDIHFACRQFGITPQCFGQAAWAKSLAALTSRLDIVFGRVVSGRNVPGGESVIGPMLNTVPCRVLFSKNMTNIELLQSLHHHNVEALSWQHSSLRSIQSAYGKSPLWDSLFLFQGVNAGNQQSHVQWKVDESMADRSEFQYAMNVELYQTTKKFTILVACRPGLMSPRSISGFLDNFKNFFLNLVQQPNDVAVASIPVHLNGLQPMQNLGLPQVTHIEQPNGHWTHRQLPVIRFLSDITRVPVSSLSQETTIISLGVDSISSIHLAAKCRRIGIAISAADVLRLDTIKDLLVFAEANQVQSDQLPEREHITKAKMSSILSGSGIPDPESVESIHCATAGMKWLIGAWQGSQGQRFQHAFAFRVSATDFDETKLREAWEMLVQYHAILRSTFLNGESDSVYVVVFKRLPKDRLWSSVKSTDARPSDDIVAEFMRNIVSRPLSTELPPARAVCFSTLDQCYLILHLHHFQYDAWSLRILLQHLGNIYDGRKLPTEDSSAMYLDHFKANDSTSKEQESYWRKHFPAHFSPSLFPHFCVGDEGSVTDGRSVHFETAVLVEAYKLKERAAALSLPLQAIFLACWARTQAKYVKGSSATFGIWHLGRFGDMKGIENFAVPCMNVLPFHVPDACSDVLEIASFIKYELRRRGPVVERSDLCDIDRWISGGGKPLHNVYLNVIAEEAGDIPFSTAFTPVKLPYYAPVATEGHETTSVVQNKLAVTDLIKDDIMIDIVLSSSQQTVDVCIEYARDILNAKMVEDIIKEWAVEVRKALHADRQLAPAVD